MNGILFGRFSIFDKTEELGETHFCMSSSVSAYMGLGDILVENLLSGAFDAAQLVAETGRARIVGPSGWQRQLLVGPAVDIMFVEPVSIILRLMLSTQLAVPRSRTEQATQSASGENR